MKHKVASKNFLKLSLLYVKKVGPHHFYNRKSGPRRKTFGHPCSRVSSKRSRTQSEVMSHKKKSIKNSVLFQGKYNELYLFIVCLFFLKYAHKKSYTSRFSDQDKCPRKNRRFLCNKKKVYKKMRLKSSKS